MKLSEKDYLSLHDAKEHFISSLDHQIVSAFEKGPVPDAAYKPMGPIQSAMKIEPLWDENKIFFNM